MLEGGSEYVIWTPCQETTENRVIDNFVRNPNRMFTSAETVLAENSDFNLITASVDLLRMESASFTIDTSDSEQNIKEESIRRGILATYSALIEHAKEIGKEEEFPFHTSQFWPAFLRDMQEMLGELERRGRDHTTDILKLADEQMKVIRSHDPVFTKLIERLTNEIQSHYSLYESDAKKLLRFGVVTTYLFTRKELKIKDMMSYFKNELLRLSTPRFSLDYCLNIRTYVYNKNICQRRWRENQKGYLYKLKRKILIAQSMKGL